MASRLYCDLDGVHVDFARGAREYFKVSPDKNPSEFDRLWKSEDGWRKLKHDWPTFWADLPPLSHSAHLWSVIKPYHPAILTAIPMGWSSSETGKHLWVRKHLPKFGMHPNETFHAVQRQEKAHYARGQDGTPNILIDDFAKNIAEWRSAGGIGILYTDSDSGVNTVKKVLSKYMM